MATHLTEIRDKLSGRDPQFGKRWNRDDVIRAGSAIGLKGLKPRAPEFLGSPKMIFNIFSDCNYYKSRFFPSEGSQQKRQVNEEQ